jgi:hypothetical protein
VNIIQAIQDRNLFRPFLQDKNGGIDMWHNWLVALMYLYRLPIKKPKNLELIKKITGRNPLLQNKEFTTALFLVGRRSGKSKIASVVAAFEAALSGRERLLSRGEIGMVSVISPTRLQSQVIKKYIRAAFETDLLKAEIVQEDSYGFELSNGVRIQTLVGDFRSVRGFTQLAVVIDECCFMGLTEESKVKNDSELIQAIRPALSTTGGKLLAISTKYAKKGWAYRTWKTNYGNDNGRILVVDAESKLMNPTLRQEIIDEALAEDVVAGRTEFLNEWRDDICDFLPIEVIEQVVIKGRIELLPNSNERYFAFCDVSGGRVDSSALAIGHRKGRKTVVDFVKEYKPPHNPYEVVSSMCGECRRFSIRQIVGDNYSAEFVKQAFEGNGIRYKKCEFPKSQIYVELIPKICSGEIELLDNEKIIGQLAGLERRTRSGGRDVVDHGFGRHDDVANACAGLASITSAKRLVVGGLQLNPVLQGIFE